MTKTEQDQFPAGFSFRVIEIASGKEPDFVQICREDWANNLMAMDLEGWMLDEDGELCLADECGNFASAPIGRFRVIFNGTPEQIRAHDDVVRQPLIKVIQEVRGVPGIADAVPTYVLDAIDEALR